MNFTIGIQICRGQKFITFISISVGSCKCFKRMEVQDCLKEEMNLQPGNTCLKIELALFCTEHQQMDPKLWKSSCPRGCLAP